MITEAARYYGPVLHALVDVSDGDVSVRRADAKLAGFYIANEEIPIYIKYSTARFGPWAFNFQKIQQQRQQDLADQYGECIMVFVCGRDGMVALRHEDFRSVLDDFFEEQEAVRIVRRRREMYQVKGRDGALERKLSRASLLEVFRDIDDERLRGAESGPPIDDKSVRPRLLRSFWSLFKRRNEQSE